MTAAPRRSSPAPRRGRRARLPRSSPAPAAPTARAGPPRTTPAGRHRRSARSGAARPCPRERDELLVMRRLADVADHAAQRVPAGSDRAPDDRAPPRRGRTGPAPCPRGQTRQHGRADPPPAPVTIATPPPVHVQSSVRPSSVTRSVRRHRLVGSRRPTATNGNGERLRTVAGAAGSLGRRMPAMPPAPRSDRTVPDKVSVDGLEERWLPVWDEQGTYTFERPRAPRPGLLDRHAAADGVGLAAHRPRVQLHPHRHDRPLPAHARPAGLLPDGVGRQRPAHRAPGRELLRVSSATPRSRRSTTLELPETPPKKRNDFVGVSRPNFIELCERLLVTDEQAFEDLFRRLGLSVDWSLGYTTISDSTRRISQRAFLRNLERGQAYSQEAPSLWDVTFQTAVAQAELEDREQQGAYHQLAFHRTDGGGGCPDRHDPARARRQLCRARCPSRRRAVPAAVRLHRHHAVFGVEVPVLAHPLAEPDKGTGIAMICTFGDLTDVIWWRELDLPTRAALGRDGRFAGRRTGVAAPTTRPGALRTHRPQGSRRRTHPDGRDADRVGRAAGRRPPDHPPGQVLREGRQAARDRHLAPVVPAQRWPLRRAQGDSCSPAARELRWHPDHMRHRYDNWVGGLNGDWLVSRQRYFGVPFPIWYPVDADGAIDHDHPIVADEPTRCRSTRRRSARPGSPRTSVASPAGSSEIPTSWTPGPRRR